MVLVRFWQELLNFSQADKLFFHFFESIFERKIGLPVANFLSFIELPETWQAFFSLFLKFFEQAKRESARPAGDAKLARKLSGINLNIERGALDPPSASAAATITSRFS